MGIRLEKLPMKEHLLREDISIKLEYRKTHTMPLASSKLRDWEND